jgi:hypothetical protein
VARPDPRTEPVDFAAHVASEYTRWSAEYRAGRVTRAVYAATLHCLGWRGADIATELALNAPNRPHWRDR